MKLGKLLKGLIPVAQTVGPIVVKEGTGSTALAVLFRQVLLAGGSILTAKGLASDDVVQAAVPAIITLGTAAYGMAKTIKERKEKEAAANPDTSAHLVLDPK